jgi:phospholipase C
MTDLFGPRAAGAPFVAYAFTEKSTFKVRDYAVAPGEHLVDSWPLEEFATGAYHIRVYGPNGFYREFIGTADDPAVDIRASYERSKPTAPDLSGNVELRAQSRDERRSLTLQIGNDAYGAQSEKQMLAPRDGVSSIIQTQRSYGWYDFQVRIAESPQFLRRCAGRVETGGPSFTDPIMGR